MKPEFTGIHHTAFATHDIEGTVRFWRDLIGLRLVYAYGSPGYRQYFFQISGDNRISFFQWDDVEPVKLRRHGDPVKGPFVFDHISIGVDDKNTLWEIMGRLDGADFHCSDVIDHGCFFSIYSYDPNGIPIEFSCDAPSCDLYWNPVMQDRGKSDFLTRPNPIPGQWPSPEPVPEDERVVVPGEGKDNFPDDHREKPPEEAPEKDHDCMCVREIMTRNVRTVTVEDEIRAVAEMICAEKISGLPVLDADSRLVGVISEKDILNTMLPDYMTYLEDPEYALDFKAMEGSYENVLQRKVGDLMSASVYSIHDDAPLMKAAAQMDLHHIRRIPVIGRDERLVGIVSLSDIHQAIFKRRLEEGAAV